MTARWLMLAACLQSSLAISTAFALEAGTASGTVTIDGVVTMVAFAASGTEEHLFDSSKRDTDVVVTDTPLASVSPADRTEIAQQVGAGKLVAVLPRFDGDKLVNVGVARKGDGSLVLLPGVWVKASLSKDGAGSRKLASREFDGHTYACDLTFHAKAVPPVAADDAAPAPTP